LFEKQLGISDKKLGKYYKK